MTELRGPYLRRPIPAATRPRRVCPRPISLPESDRDPRETDWKGRDRARQLACCYPEQERERERKGGGEARKKKVASKEARSQEKATGGRTSGKRVMIIDCGQFPSIEPPISHAAFQFQTLSSRAAAHITSRHLLVYLSLASRFPGLCFPRKSCFLPRRVKCRTSTS